MVLFHDYEKKIKPGKGEESAQARRKRLLLHGVGREKPFLEGLDISTFLKEV